MKRILSTILAGTLASGTAYAQWNIKDTLDPFTDKREIIASVSSVDADAYIIVQCAENKTAIVYDPGRYVGSKGRSYRIPVRYRIEKEKAISESWEESTNNNPSLWSGKAIAFLRKLQGKTTLAIEATKYDYNRVSDVFQIQGIDEVIKKVSTACNWK